MRRILADTVALLAYSVLIGAFIETVVIGLSWQEMVQARVGAIPIALAVARPYGLYRDRVLRYATRRFGDGRARTTFYDMAAFVSFQLPLYAGLLYWVGAGGGEIALAMPAAVIAMVVTGRPYGVFLDACRRFFRAV